MKEEIQSFEKVREMQATANGEYAEHVGCCHDRTRNPSFEVKAGQSEAKSLMASSELVDLPSETLTAKIEEIASAISTEHDGNENTDKTKEVKIDKFECKEEPGEYQRGLQDDLVKMRLRTTR